MTLPTHEEILSAFVDGEPVEPRALLAALEGPDALPVLRDFIRLRVDVAGPGSGPSVEWGRRVSDLMADARRPTWRRSVRVPLPAAVAAGVALAVTAGALLIGRPSGTPPAPASAAEPASAPTAQRVVQFEPEKEWWEGRR